MSKRSLRALLIVDVDILSKKWTDVEVGLDLPDHLLDAATSMQEELADRRREAGRRDPLPYVVTSIDAVPYASIEHPEEVDE